MTDPDDLDTNEWLAQISHQLYVQNQLLQELVGEPQKKAEQYVCDFCDETVSKDQREAHLRQNHNPPGGVDVSKRFTQV